MNSSSSHVIVAALEREVHYSIWNSTIVCYESKLSERTEPIGGNVMKIPYYNSIYSHEKYRTVVM